MTIAKKDGQSVNPLLINGKPITSQPAKADEFSEFEANYLISELKILIVLFCIFILFGLVIGAAQLINNYMQKQQIANAQVQFDPCKGQSSYQDKNQNTICAPAGQHLGRGVQSEWEVK